MARCGELEALFAWERVCVGPSGGNNTDAFLPQRNTRGHEAAQKMAGRATERARADHAEGGYPLWRETSDQGATERHYSGAHPTTSSAGWWSLEREGTWWTHMNGGNALAFKQPT
jgi:hypothetical protein